MVSTSTKRRSARVLVASAATVLALLAVTGCSTAGPERTDGGHSLDVVMSIDAADDGATMPPDAADAPGSDADGGCFLTTVGVWGECISTSDCAALGNHVATPGFCPGPTDIQCCTLAPNVADNPPIPAGWQLMAQSSVTPDMTNWAVMILHDPVTYPMFSTTMQMFGSLLVMARVEWHPPDFQNSAVHRGVTLYQPI